MLNKVLLFPCVVVMLSLISTINYHNNDPKPRRLELLFLGHQSKHHDSEKLADILIKEYFKQGINITYTTKPEQLNDSVLNHYDGLILYANHDSITSTQEKALLGFVKGGKGFIPLHCASHCFRNSPEVVDLIGGQFSKHGLDSFAAVISKPDHPVMKGIPTFTTKDETYIHQRLSNNIEVLSERMDGERREPYTWIRQYGDGRVFYTAYGHDENTFRQQAFLDLVRNGILWAVGDERVASLRALAPATPGYHDGPVPNYEKRDPAPKVQEALSPAQSMSQIQVPVGFELQLFASEPEILNPIYMNWDERGRLWVIETIDYPNEVKDGEKGDDRIKIIEDTDGDGKADKFTIFADSLNIPTSFVFINGGIMVSAAPSFIFLKDTDGDDKADVREPMLKGWGKFDTHAQASNLRYGFDNQVWGVVGYSGFKGKVGNDSLKFENGVFRLTTDGKKLEHLSTTSNNTWGLGFSEEADVFISTANNTHTGFLGIPKKYKDLAGIKESGVKKLDAHYQMHVATKYLRQVDVHGGFTAAAGHSLYTARNFPQEYWNRVAFVTEPTGRLVHRVILKQDGAGFKEDGDGWNMLLSADEWAAPIQAEVGPDGALWIADWYDFIIQHNPTPNLEKAGLDAQNGAGNAYINPLRDRQRGRIYRLAYKANDHRNHIQLQKNNHEALIKALSHDNLFWRLTAQRLLVENGDQSVVPALVKLVEDQKLDPLKINAAATHALWTLHGLKALQSDNGTAVSVAIKALKHPAAGVRRAAIEVLPKTASSFRAMQQAKVFEDKDLRVRLAAVLAATHMKPSASIADVLASMAGKKENVTDQWVREGLSIAAKVNESAFRTALARQNPKNRTAILRTLGLEGKPATAADATKVTEKIDQTIVVKVVKDVMKFDKELITAKAGTTIRIVLENPDFMQHNLVLIRPNTSAKVGAAADRMVQDADGAKLHYVPKMQEVVASTPLVNPGGKFTLTVKVPQTTGDYPYLCTFPGHWRIMNGILRVTR